MLGLGPLWGGGFVPAFLQLVALYYPAGLLLHCVAPRLLPVKGVQVAPRNEGDVWRDALTSLGERALFLFFWTGGVCVCVSVCGCGPLVARRPPPLRRLMTAPPPPANTNPRAPKHPPTTHHPNTRILIANLLNRF